MPPPPGKHAEHGPYTLVRNKDSPNGVNAVPANHTWASVGHMLYVDQPVDTGLSYTANNGTRSKTMLDVGNTLQQLLQASMARRDCSLPRSVACPAPI